MHTSADQKPVKKCHGCPLNQKKSCAVFSNPHEQWSGHKRCKGYMNQTLYEHYLDEQLHPLNKSHKQVRQEKAAELKTVTHRDGILNPRKSRR